LTAAGRAGDTAGVLGPRFRALVQAALASGALVLSGCFSDKGVPPPEDTEATSADPTLGTTGEAVTGTGEPPAPPQLIEVKRVDTALVLTFSEPINIPADLDPEQFRLSAAIAHPDGAKTAYYDPGPWNIYCYVPMTTGMEDCYAVDLTAVIVEPTAQSDELLIEFFTEFYPSLCMELDARAKAIGSTGALYLHYSDNGPPITDLDGEALVAIGEPWVLDQFSTELSVPGEFPFLNPRLPIPCPIP
jgi:hypothetical protein